MDTVVYCSLFIHKTCYLYGLNFEKESFLVLVLFSLFWSILFAKKLHCCVLLCWFAAFFVIQSSYCVFIIESMSICYYFIISLLIITVIIIITIICWECESIYCKYVSWWKEEHTSVYITEHWFYEGLSILSHTVFLSKKFEKKEFRSSSQFRVKWNHLWDLFFCRVLQICLYTFCVQINVFKSRKKIGFSKNAFCTWSVLLNIGLDQEIRLEIMSENNKQIE